MGEKQAAREIIMPDLELPGARATLSVWLVPRGARVVAGDRIIEILAGDVTVDLPAPASGILLEQTVVEDDSVEPGQVLGLIA